VLTQRVSMTGKTANHQVVDLACWCQLVIARRPLAYTWWRRRPCPQQPRHRSGTRRLNGYHSRGRECADGPLHGGAAGPQTLGETALAPAQRAFESVVESDDRPTVTALAQRGTKTALAECSRIDECKKGLNVRKLD
jgi:hypothetical protein